MLSRAIRRVGRIAREGRVSQDGLAAILAILAAIFTIGCTPSVGDSCQLSTDCGSTGQLVCDTSQLDGYCTLVGCISDECPDDAACVLFGSTVPGCSYNDYQAGSRVSQTFCMATCNSSSDCRYGYICVDPTESPWFAVLQDNNQQELVCIPEPNNGQVGGTFDPGYDPDAAVCQMNGPGYDANFPPYDANFSTSPPDASSESSKPDGD